MADLSDREKKVLECGVSIGFACAAGMAGGCPEMNGPQVGAMLEAFAEDRTSVATVSSVVVADTIQGTHHTLDSWAGLMRHLLEKAKGEPRG